MNRRALLALLLAGLLTGPGLAGIFGKKPAKVNPAERVPELLKTLKLDGDENKRIEAVDELRYYDITTFPQVVPALIEVVRNDPKPAVRSETVETLGKLRPVSEVVWHALQEARDKDASMRVRMQARASLLGYHWSLSSQSKPNDPQNPTKEPPLIDPKADSPPVIRTQSPPPPPPRIIRNTQEPPLAVPSNKSQNTSKQPAKPPANVATLPNQPSKFPVSVARPMPSGPVRPPVQTQEPPLADPEPIAPSPLSPVIKQQPSLVPMPMPLPAATQSVPGEGPELPPQE